MSFSRLWNQFVVAALLLCTTAAARGQEASSDNPAIKQAQLTASTPAPANSSTPSNSTESAAEQPATKKPEPAVDPLLAQIQTAVEETSRRRLTAGEHTPWQIVHGILALRWELMLLNKTSPGADVNAIEWITSGVMHEGLPLWEQTPYGGRGHPYTHPYAFEGHPTQFMGYMTMANIPLEYEVRTPTKVITIRDIINDAKMQVRQGVEITWTLWALAHYEEPDAQWFNAAGEPWSIERLVKMQIDEPVTSGACGGTHGLFALAYARNMYISTGRPLRGVWLEADQKIKRYIAEARALQNPDGSFSTNHFAGPGYSDDFAVRIATSGHELEWLMIALPQSKLKEEWIRRGIANVANDLIKNKHQPSDCGPLFHGVHALVVYRQRTVPGYLVPQFNSYVKLSDREKPRPAVSPAAAAPKGAKRPDGWRKADSTRPTNPPRSGPAATNSAANPEPRPTLR